MSDSRRVSEDSVPWIEVRGPSGTLRMRVRRLGAATGGERLGATLYEIPVGQKNWPFHYHLANEESIFVLAGEGRVRFPDQELPLVPGDYVTFPVGEAGAHQIVNEGDEALRFLCLSTMIEPDIAIYPDSGKVGLFGGGAPGTDPDKRSLNVFLRHDATIDYWDGEDA